MFQDQHKIHVVDSHTEGEPTRVVTEGFPELKGLTPAEKMAEFKSEWDHLRTAIVMEPRGHEAIVGALLLPSSNPACAAGVVFFNNVGFLKMCGHGTIGVVRTLEHVGRISAGWHLIETPAGTVEAELDGQGAVTVKNIESYRYRKGVDLKVDGYGTVRGDIAWGGNWFFLADKIPDNVKRGDIGELGLFTRSVRSTLAEEKITGKDGAEIDHIEVFWDSPTADSRNFVLCPGGAYDRSPCGTGTSAKVACLFEDGKLKEGEVWVQESVIGSRFEARVKIENGKVIPFIKGTAHITAESDLILSGDDPFRFGIPTGCDSV